MHMFILALLLAFTAAPALAAYSDDQKIVEPYAYHDYERFKIRAPARDISGGFNARLKEITKEEAPEFIQHFIADIAEKCTSDAANMRYIKVYRYTSNRMVEQNLQPDFLFDTMGLLKKPQKGCEFGRLCRGDACQLVGLAAQPDNQTWIRAFAIPTLKWKPRTVHDEASEKKVTVLSILSRANCKRDLEAEAEAEYQEPDEEKREPTEPCAADYVWLGNTLMAYDREGLFGSARPAPPAAAEEKE